MGEALRVGSFCSGIAAPETAWTRLGWEPAFFSEIDPFASAVLAHRYPHVPNLGDMEKISAETLRRYPVDVVVAGTPCQSFSVAGLRGGMADPRGNLALVFLRLVDVARPAWVVWENVPGVLSSNDGRDFGAFLGALGELGYGWSYRVLDAQHFGVPQRRRRVFVVGHLGDWRRAAAVLFERHSLSGHPAPGREAGARVAASLTRGADSGGKGGYAGRRQEDDYNLVASTGETSHCLNAGGMGRQDFETETLIAHSLRADGFDASEDGTGRGTPLVSDVDGGTGPRGDREGDGRDDQVRELYPVAFQTRIGRNGRGQPETVCPTLQGAGAGATSDMRPCIATPSMAVRRLMPVECERLQGFPDDWTLIPHRGKEAADGPRYRAIGNSMAVPVLLWIGRRIDAVRAAVADQAGKGAA